VFNGAKHVRQSIESILGQTFGDLELIISDNASTDDTAQICAGLAASDQRIKFSRNDSNIGAAQNFTRVHQAATGRYFMWAGAHDLWHPQLIERAVEGLESHPGAVIAGADCRWIDAQGNPFPRESGWTDTRGMSSVERFFTVLFGNMHPVLGLMRNDALVRTSGMRASMGSDLVLLCELALLGDFIHVPGTHWSRRELRGSESYRDMLKRYRSADYAITRGPFERRFPAAALAARLLSVAWSIELGFAGKMAVCASLLGVFPARYVGARLRRR
jgi:glycosyltransferase involved in cell wall biosynthesis